MNTTSLAPNLLALSFLVLAGLGAGTAPALAAEPTLKVRQGDIFSDPVGTVMAVSVVNEGTATVGAAVVTCDFTTAGRTAGTASTTIYNIEAGSTGQDQVHLLGSKADAAQCVVSSTAPAAN